MSLSARRRMNLRLDLQAALAVSQNTACSVIDLNMPGNLSPMCMDSPAAEVDVEMVPYKSTKGRVATPYYPPQTEMRHYLVDIKDIDINPYKGDWLDRVAPSVHF